MVERLNNTIETQVSEGNTLVTQVNENKQVIQTTIQNVPQIQTVLQNGINVSSQINAPFVEVTSVNGMTGDVITEMEILDFEANKYYRKNTLVNHEGKLYWAKENFTSGSTFDSNDWNAIEAGDINWSDISNKPTFATVATSGSYTDLINIPSPYSLPVASSSVLGGIKVGDNLSIDENGILSASGGGQGGKVFYITDTLNTLEGSFPNLFRIFKDSSYTEEVEIGEINGELELGTPLSVRVERSNESGAYLWGTIESGFYLDGIDRFCIKLMGQTMSSPTDFLVNNSVSISATTYYYQANDITPINYIPTASSSTKGIVSIGDGLNITSAGLLSAKLQFVDGPSAEDIDWSLVINKIYPVGSIYISTTLDTAAKVQTAFGGTWIAWGSGRVPVGVDTSQTEFDTVEETGGEKNHTLTIEEMPSHSHNIYDVDTGTGGSGKRDGLYYQGGWWGNSIGAPNVGNTGGSKAHNNLQPYITCYMYKRTA